MAKTTTHRAGTSGRSYRLSRRLADPPSSLHGRGSSNGPSRRWQRIIARTVHSLRGSRASWNGRPQRPPITRFHARDEASGHILRPGPWNALRLSKQASAHLGLLYSKQSAEAVGG